MPRFLAAAVALAMAHGLAPSFKTTISSNSNDWKKGVDEALTLLALERGTAPRPGAIVTVGLPLERCLRRLSTRLLKGRGRRPWSASWARASSAVARGGVPAGVDRRGNLPEGSEVAPFTLSGDLEDPRQHRDGAFIAASKARLLLGDPFSPITAIGFTRRRLAAIPTVVGGLSCPASQERLPLPYEQKARRCPRRRARSAV